MGDATQAYGMIYLNGRMRRVAAKDEIRSVINPSAKASVLWSDVSLDKAPSSSATSKKKADVRKVIKTAAYAFVALSAYNKANIND